MVTVEKQYGEGVISRTVVYGNREHHEMLDTIEEYRKILITHRQENVKKEYVSDALAEKTLAILIMFAGDTQNERSAFEEVDIDKFLSV